MKIILFFFVINLPFFLSAQNNFLFVGTYTSGESKGIYVYRFDPSTGNMTLAGTASSQNPSYLAIGNNGKTLYAVNENGGEQPGMVSSYSFDQSSGNLRLLNSKPSGGDHPCYVSVDKKNRHVVVGNYSGGSLAIFPIQPDGSLDNPSQLIVQMGKGKDPDRQEKAHVHAVVFSPDNKTLFVPDLGIDKIMAYTYQPGQKKPLKESITHHIKTLPGSGPRHLEFHPSRPFAYLVEELTGTVSAYRYDHGKLVFLQRLSTFPKGHTGEKGSADIHCSPDGQYLYVSNRGKTNNLAIFAIENSIGSLRHKGFVGTGGATPRNFAIDPKGNFLLVANQNSNNIVVFKRNKSTGMLTKTEQEIKVPNPVCLKFLSK